jgi:NAD(P)-dependent dehydrogenase (short-subunit alcohol dehydrogenase family)
MGLLDDKVAIVTGAGGGLGRAYAELFAAEGAAVVVNDVDLDRAETVAEAVRRSGGCAIANGDDVATVGGGEAILEAAIDAFHSADVLVNNAGFLRDVTLANMTEAAWDEVIAVHLKALYCVTRPVFAHMKAAGRGGVIVNTSSAAGLVGNFGQTNYAAAKAGVWGFSHALALEGRKYGVRVWTLAPGAGTRLSADLVPEHLKDRLTPEQVAPAVLYMVSALSEPHTDRTLVVSGAKVFEIQLAAGPAFRPPAGGADALGIARAARRFMLPDLAIEFLD